MQKSFQLKLLIFLILLAPIVDIATGYFTAVLKSNSITPGILYKGAFVIPLFLWFCIKSKSKILLLFYIGLGIMMISFSYRLLTFQDTALISNTGRLLQIFYPFLGFAAFKYMHKKKKYIEEKTLWRIGYYIGLITVLGVIIFGLSGLGVTNYNKVDYTTSGLNTAGNDTGLVILISYCLFLYYNRMYQTRKFIKLILVSFLYLFATFQLQTRALLLGIPVAFIFIINASVFTRDLKNSLLTKNSLWTKFSVFSIMTIFIWLGIEAVSYLDENDLAFSIERIRNLSAGNSEVRILDEGLTTLAHFSLFDHLFGIGEANFPLVENDLIDIYGRYGVLFLVMLCSMILYFFQKIYCSFLKNRSLATLTLSIGITFYVFHGAIAGHAYSSAQVNTIMIIVYFLIYRYSSFKKIKF